MKPLQHKHWIGGLLIFLAAPIMASSMKTMTVTVPELKFRVESVGGFHALDIDNKNGTAPTMTTGFPAAIANLYIFATVADGIDVFTEYYLSSKHHLGDVYDNEGYVMFNHLPSQLNKGILESIFKVIDVKAGHFEVDFGNQHWVRSDEGEVQKNPLVGNYLVDPQLVEGGAEIIGHHNWFHWVLGAGNGVTSEDFRNKRDYSKHGKIQIEPESKKFNLAFSVYAVDQSENKSSESSGNLFSGARSGSRYAGLNPATGASDPDFAQLLLGAGQDEFAWQADASVNLGPLWLSGLFGFYEDADTDGYDKTSAATIASTAGEPEDQWTYYGAEAKLDITKNGYLAARYSGAQADRIGSVTSKAKADRIQVGYGYHLVDGILFKAEYMNQKMDEFPTTGNSRYTKYANDVKIEGITMEIAVAFGNAAPYESSTSGWGSGE